MQFDTEITTSNTGNPLVPSLSIQSKDGSYFLFPDDSELDDFLSDLDIERKDIPVDSQYLLTLFQQEKSACSWMKWSSLDHALEKMLQWPLLSVRDLGPETKASAWRRVRPAERSILLKNTWGLVKAYAVQGFVRGLELGLFTSIHLFIYSMLFYRLVKLIQTGSTSIEEFRASFIGSDQKGIDSLVRLLAGLEARWLRLILTSPFIIGGLQSISSLLGVRRASSATLQNYIQTIDTHLQTGGSWLRDGVYEYLPGISSAGFLSLSGKLQKIESLVRWDGRLSSVERTQIFDALCRVATTGGKNTQLNALQYLAKIAHGVGFKDLPRLKETGYSKEELMTMLYIKGKALEVILSLPEEEIKESKPLRCQAIQSLPQHLYRQYLLWWLLGVKAHFFKQQLPFFLLKAAKLAVELYFFQMIVLSILEAIRCPDKPGFQLGFGYPEWATELTSDCFSELIENQFRSVNLSDPVDDLVAQIPLFNLVELHSLLLSYKNLTGTDMVQILTAITARGAPLTSLAIYDDFRDSDMEVFVSYLKISTIRTIKLGCQSFNNYGGEGLTSQGLEYLINVLPDTQLTYLQICFPKVDNTGMISLAKQLNKTSINQFYLDNADIDDNAGQALAQVLSTMPMQRIQLTGSRISDGTVHALAPVVLNSLVLTELWVQGDFITDQGAHYFAQIIQQSTLDTIAILSANITDEGVIALSNSLKALPTLTHGITIGSQCGEKGIIALAQQLNQTNFGIFELVGYGNLLTVNSMQALSLAFSSTEITKFWLQGYQLNNETLAWLAKGINSSLITHLDFDHITFIDSIAVLGPAIRQLEALQFSFCHLTDSDLIVLVPYLSRSAIQALHLIYNNINDAGVLALAEILPYINITDLGLHNNNITDVSAQVLADIYSSTLLQELYLYGNNVSSELLSQIESFQLQRYCQDQLCHANTQYNGYSGTLGKNDLSSSVRHPSYRRQNRLGRSRKLGVFDQDGIRINKKINWDPGSSIDVFADDSFAVTTDTALNHPPAFFAADFLPNWNPPALPSPYVSTATEPLFTPTDARAMLVGTAILGILLYKNLISVQTLINKGYQILQRCIYGSASDHTMPLDNFVEQPSLPNPYLFFSSTKAKSVSAKTTVLPTSEQSFSKSTYGCSPTD